MVYTPDQVTPSQYANSQRLGGIAQSFYEAINVLRLQNDFYDKVWNIDTAVGWGLDFWGKIVGVGRVLNVATSSFFGFAESSSAQPFNQGVFYNGVGGTSNYALSDDAYRILILAKALANITNCTSASINQILLNLFPGRGNCYVEDNEDMSMTYVFTFSLSPVERAIVLQSGVLPAPAGIKITVTIP